MLLILLLSFHALFDYADKPLQVNDKVYLHSTGGLILRKTPAKDGEKITLLPFNGQPLTVIAAPESDKPYTAEQIGAFAVKGNWVKVKTERGLEGYLFDGYLSRYQPINSEKMDGSIDVIDGFYRTISPVKGKRTTLPPTKGAIERYQQLYTDGARFEEQQYQGGVTHFLELPQTKFTLQEAFVLFRAAWFAKEKTTGKYDAAKQQLTIDGVDGYSQLIIQPKGDRWLLQFSSAD
ncbi:hypothetical protein GCM10028805_38490 [Spirosoma harenae]